MFSHWLNIFTNKQCTHIVLTVVIKNPSDFVGNVLGQSESNTKAILATTVGKVLVIDEVSYLVLSLSFVLTDL